MTPNRKRILFIITQSEMGGAQRFLYNLLARIGSQYEIKVGVGSEDRNWLKDSLAGINIETHTLSYLKRNISPKNDIKACSEIRKLIEEFQPNDLFLMSSKAGFIGSLAAIFPSKIYGLRVIYRIGGWSFNDPQSIFKKKLWLNLERFSAKWKDIIIVNSKQDLEQAEELGIKPKEKVIMVSNGLDPYKLNFLPRDEAKIKLFEKLAKDQSDNLPAGRQEFFKANIIIGTIANLYPTKGLSFLIDAAEHFKNNPEVVFFIIGEGQERDVLTQKIKDRGLNKKIFLLGQIPDAYKLIPAFDIFVLPSLKEGFPWVLIEAMTAKIPVIATRVGAVPEIVDDGKNGFIVEPGNSTQLAKRLKELLANDYLCKEMGIQGHQTVLFSFSEDKMIKEIEGVL